MFMIGLRCIFAHLSNIHICIHTQQQQQIEVVNIYKNNNNNK